MKRMAYERYGGPSDVVRFSEGRDPKIGPESVLVQIRAAGVNPVDWQTIAGHLDSRFDIVFPVVPGWDLAGSVLEVGPNVTRFAVGDDVFGYARADVIHHGTYAERIVVPDRVLARKPGTLSWAQAAATPVAALTAYQALTDVLQVQAGETLLVQAAAGGVGSFATQIARQREVDVIGTASHHHHAELRAHAVTPIDYHSDIAAAVRAIAPTGVDAVLDMYGGPDLAVHASLLARQDSHRIVSLADDGVREIGGRFLFARPDGLQLGVIAEMLDADHIAPIPLTTSSWKDAVEVLQAGSVGALTGKHVLLID